MERVLPDGSFELIINLCEESRKMFDRENLSDYTLFKRGWISGAHSEYIVIDTSPGASMIGAHFKPGGIAPFVRSSASEFRDEVVEFEAVWGGGARCLREQLLAASTPEAKIHLLEQFLGGLLSRSRSDPRRHKRAMWATEQFCREPHLRTIAVAARTLGISHKHFIEQFQRHVGLTPKLFCRIRRFQEVLQEINSHQGVRWADLACGCGYYDQAHLIRDFRAFAGLIPSAYQCLDGDYASFVPIEAER
jgi:AraC-like DNA-binding protein